PWTYLGLADDIERGVAGATVTSGLRASFAPRRRVQTLALGINRRGAATRLKLMTRPPSHQPLAGVEVEIVSPDSGSPSIAKEATQAAASDSTPANEAQAADDSDFPPPSKQGAGGLKPQAAGLAVAATPTRFVADRNGVVELSANSAPTGKPV